MTEHDIIEHDSFHGNVLPLKQYPEHLHRTYPALQKASVNSSSFKI